MAALRKEGVHTDGKVALDVGVTVAEMDSPVGEVGHDTEDGVIISTGTDFIETFLQGLLEPFRETVHEFEDTALNGVFDGELDVGALDDGDGDGYLLGDVVAADEFGGVALQAQGDQGRVGWTGGDADVVGAGGAFEECGRAELDVEPGLGRQPFMEVLQQTRGEGVVGGEVVAGQEVAVDELNGRAALLQAVEGGGFRDLGERGESAGLLRGLLNGEGGGLGGHRLILSPVVGKQFEFGGREIIYALGEDEFAYVAAGHGVRIRALIFTT